MRLSATLCFLASAASLSAAAPPEARSPDVTGSSLELSKRFDDATLTYYNVGLGACGQVDVASDYVVALDSAQWSGGAHCFQRINITANGKSAVATIVDDCADCSDTGLDLSTGLFQFFAPLSAGELQGTCNFV
ncbi:hypothetical protein FA95DRAFT_1526387 [Auriscalpium vulgare]|uniref:Uncharacterized protein n=1 Tax=Auriscalpium vulgare TaxID=40419 RepID=A0ACB8RDB7_9AGAM|nr:hypothetical protein FA95DRAFT_1526387 [Auriscalpium vulgare]